MRKEILNTMLVVGFLTACSSSHPDAGEHEVILPHPTLPSETPPSIPQFTQIPTTQLIETQVPTPEIPPAYKMFGIDFSDPTKKINITINLSNGQTFTIDTNTTTTDCNTNFDFEDKSGCIYQFQNYPQDGVYFIHSGWFHQPNGIGGINYIKLAGEDVRHGLEDATNYWDDTKRLSLEQIQERMFEFMNAKVSINQGDTVSDNLHVVGITRLPPDKLGPFQDVCPNISGSQTTLPDGMSFDNNWQCVGEPTGTVEQLSNEDIPPTLAAVNPVFSEFMIDGKPQLIIIFCGWGSPEEADIPPGAQSFYTSTRYAIAIGEP